MPKSMALRSHIIGSSDSQTRNGASIIKAVLTSGPEQLQRRWHVAVGRGDNTQNCWLEMPVTISCRLRQNKPRSLREVEAAAGGQAGCL